MWSGMASGNLKVHETKMPTTIVFVCFCGVQLVYRSFYSGFRFFFEDSQGSLALWIQACTAVQIWYSDAL